MSSIQLPPLAGRGSEVVFSPPSTSRSSADSGTSNSAMNFRSPRPSSQSNIRVITRIRPLLEEEVVRGRKPAILPIQPLSQSSNADASTSSTPTGELECSENISPTNSSTMITPRNDNKNSLQSIPLPSSSNRRSISKNNTPSIVPPSTPSSLLLNDNAQQKTSFQTPTSALATKGYSKTTTAAATPSSLHAGLSPSSRKQFDFDAVLDMNSTQQQAYETAVGDRVLHHIFKGINFTIMAYGQTASGKTYTMQGISDDITGMFDSENQCPNSPKGISEHDGIIPRVIHDLFQGKMDYKASGKGNVSMDLTYFELYNDEIRDLLSEEDEFRALKMLDQGEGGGVIVEGLTSIPIDSASQVHDLIHYAAERRATASTNANVQSSRSHAICTLTVKTSTVNSNSKVNGSETRHAKLTLVDLAGSERIKKTGVVGVQQQESITINKDLFVLGKVVSALADKSRSAGKGKQAHIPFRDSKLTRLLRESLGGNTYTVLISCISPADIDMEESMNTLRYAERARSISNSIKRNVVQAMPTAAEFAAMQAEIRRLKVENSKLKNRVAAEISKDVAGSLLDQEDEPPQQVAVQTPSSIHQATPIVGSVPQEIFRLPPPSQSIQSDSSKSRKPTPVWMHFKTLAKYSGDVPEIQKRQQKQQRQPEGLELKEVRSFDSHNIDSLSEQRLSLDGPERCLAYEMSLFPSDTDDLKEDHDDDGEQQKHKDAEMALANILEKQEELQKTLDKYSQQKKAMEDSIKERQKELDNINQELISSQSNLGKGRSNVETLQQEQTKRDELREEIAELENIMAKLMTDESFIASADPQKSFFSIENDALRPRYVDVEIEIETDGSENALMQRFENSLEKLNKSYQMMDSVFRPQDESIASIIDMETKVEEKEKEINELQESLSNEKRKGRESDRNMAIKESQVEALQERIAGLQGELEMLKLDKQDATTKNLDLQRSNETLETKLKEEKERSACIEARHNFLCQEYESTAAALNDKISSLRDQAREEKNRNQQEICKFRSVKEDFKYQIETLKNSIVEFESKLDKEIKLKEEAQAQATSLQPEYETLQDSFKKEKAENAKELELLQTKHSDEISELKHYIGKANAELKILQEKLNLKKVDASTSTTAPEGESKVELKKEEIQDALLQIIASASCDANEDGDSPRSAESNKPSPNSIRVQAEKLLQRADAFIDSSSIAASSALSSAGTDFRPSKIVQDYPLCQPVHSSCSSHGKPPMIPRPPSEEKEVHITNLAVVENQNICSCSSNIFAANAEYVEFYLPKISVECTCGRMSPEKHVEENEDPCALGSILRPWQVEFLETVGIKDPVSFVHENNQRGGQLAKDLRRWRKARGMPSIRTRSCSVALHIWSRTCKTVVRSVRSQEALGIVPKRPEFLELNISENNTAISSLGGGPFHISAK